jgi:hypothetical protein
MANPPRRVPPPSLQDYAAVSTVAPTSPKSQRVRSRSGRLAKQKSPAGGRVPQAAMTQGVASGSIGGGYGPYAVRILCPFFVLQGLIHL